MGQWPWTGGRMRVQDYTSLVVEGVYRAFFRFVLLQAATYECVMDRRYGTWAGRQVAGTNQRAASVQRLEFCLRRQHP